MKKLLIVFLVLFVTNLLFAGGESETTKKVDRESWKQSKVDIKYIDGPEQAQVSISLNNGNPVSLGRGANVLLNCSEGNNTIKIIAGPNGSGEIKFNSSMNITFMEFSISQSPMESTATITMVNGRKNALANLFVNGSLISTIEPQQTKEIALREGQNVLEIKSGKRHVEQFNIQANSNNTNMQFETGSGGRIQNFRLGVVRTLVKYNVIDLVIVKTEIVTMPEELKRQIDEEDRQIALLEQRFNNMVFKPSNFSIDDISKYKNRDLFEAVSSSRNIERASNKLEIPMLTIQSFGLVNYSMKGVSDVTFVRQDGTDITFSSDDNAISQRMSIRQRSGLQAGQKVRVYYEVTRAPLLEWEVIAIERR